MTHSELQREFLAAVGEKKVPIFERIGTVLGICGRRVEAQAAAIAELRRRVELLEASRFDYVGIHEEHKAYRSGEVVTRGGGLWLALRETSTRPGTDSSAWRLVVKKGDFDLR